MSAVLGKENNVCKIKSCKSFREQNSHISYILWKAFHKKKNNTVRPSHMCQIKKFLQCATYEKLLMQMNNQLLAEKVFCRE